MVVHAEEKGGGEGLCDTLNPRHIVYAASPSSSTLPRGASGTDDTAGPFAEGRINGDDVPAGA